MQILQVAGYIQQIYQHFHRFPQDFQTSHRISTDIRVRPLVP